MNTLESSKAGAPRTRVAVAAIVAAAFVVRLIYVFQSRSSPLFDAPIMDAKYHVDWATAFARGEDFQPGPFFRAPLYPWFLGACFKLLGQDLLIPRLVQAGFGAATTLLTYLIGTRAFDRRVGLIASIAAACSWILVFYDGELLLESLSIPLNLLALWLAMRASDDSRPGRWGVAGAAFGLAAITRPNVLLAAIGVALWIAWTRRSALRAAIAASAAFAAGLALPILPLTIYNATVGGDRVLISSQAGVNLWIGNNPDSDGSSAIVPGTREDWWGGYHDSIALAERASGRRLKPSEVSSFFTERAIDFWRSEPARALALLARKLRLFWLDWELGNNEEPSFFARTFAPISRFLPYSFGVVAALAAIGLIASLRRAGPVRLLSIFTLGYSASVVVFFVCSRYRAPIVPPLLVYAAFGALWVVECARARRGLALAGAGLVAAISAGLSWTEPAGLRTSDANGLGLVGVAYAASGHNTEALAALDRALALEPANTIVARQRAFVLRAANRLDDAAAAFEAVLALRPDDAAALDGYADLSIARHDLARAGQLAERQMALAGGAARGWYNRGRVAVEQRDFDDAAKWFEGALERAPDDFNAAYALALTRNAQGRVDDACELLRRAVRARVDAEQRPFLRDAFTRLAALLAARGDLPSALATLDRALAEFPNDSALVAQKTKLAAPR